MSGERTPELQRTTVAQLSRPRLWRVIGACVLAALIALPVVLHAQPAAGQLQQASSTTVVVAGDGSATVNQTVSVYQNATSATLPLLSPSVGDILVLNQADSPVSYEVDDGNITLYTLGDTLVLLSYETNSLTTKQGSIWTVGFTVENATLVLPYQSTILSISAAPISESVVKGSPTLVLGSGEWQVSYGLPIVAASTSTSTSSPPSTSSVTSAVSSSRSSASSRSSTSNETQSTQSSGGPSTTLVPPWGVVVLGSAAAVVVLILALASRRRRQMTDPSQLRPDDLETLRFIRDRGGRVVEAEIRERFTAPRTSAWRQIKRLEQLGYVRVSKLGSQNQIELVRSDFERPAG